MCLTRSRPWSPCINVDSRYDKLPEKKEGNITVESAPGAHEIAQSTTTERAPAIPEHQQDKSSEKDATAQPQHQDGRKTTLTTASLIGS